MERKTPWYKSEWFQTFKIAIFIVIGVLFIGLLVNLHDKTEKTINSSDSFEEKLRKINKRVSEIEKLKVQFVIKLKNNLRDRSNKISDVLHKFVCVQKYMEI